MRIDKKRVSTLFALTLLIVSLLLANMNGPTSAASPPAASGTAPASTESETIHLHGPSLVPIHMHGPPLQPVHMHSLIGLIDLYNPLDTPWHELHPDYCENWTLRSWENTGNEYLDTCDQIDMTNNLTQEVRWYHVDRVTMTMRVFTETPGPYEPEMYIEFKGPYEEMIYPICTLWHEVWPVYSNVYHITNWTDNDNGYLDVCDFIEFEQWPGVWWHVEEYATDLILNEKVMDPIGIEWHELYPSYCTWHTLTSWEEPEEEPYTGRLSPGDQIDMINETSGITEWYFVDRVTFTMLVSNESDPEDTMYIEYKGPFKTMYEIKTDPVNTSWHEVYPRYSNVYNITWWDDNCNGVLDECDYIEMQNITVFEGPYSYWHVEELAIDIILNKKIGNPECTTWHELHPECCVNDYHIDYWEDNGDYLLSPCDNVTMTLLPDGATDRYHVENVTLTLNLTLYDYMGPIPPERMYAEFTEGYEWMYYAKIYPEGTEWEVVCPDDWFGYNFTIQYWEDNCNGILSHCDYIEWMEPEIIRIYHVEEVAIDIIVEKIPELVHDVAVVEVFSEYAWVYQGEIDPIHVTVTNLGDYDEPTVDVYAFYDGNLAASPKTTSLNIGDTKVLTFDWDTSGVTPGLYTVSANATIPVDDVPGNNYLQGNDQEVKERPPPPPPLPVTADLELYPRDVVDLEVPISTQWHELHPNKTNFYHLTDWEPGMVLSPEDIVFMNGIQFIVDEVTIDIIVYDELEGILRWMVYECGYWTFKKDVWKSPECSKWNEIKNDFGPVLPPRCWHLTGWIDDGDGKLSYGDLIEMTPMYPYPEPPRICPVQHIGVTLKLTEEPAPVPPVQYYLSFLGELEEFQIMDLIHMPWGTPWQQILPHEGQGLVWELMDWLDQLFLSPSDQILLTLKDPETHEPIPIPEAQAWYHVDKLTVAMNLTSIDEPGVEHIVKYEGSLRQFKIYYWEEPWGTQWHEVNPTYCRQWYLYDWLDDNGNYILDYCDYILMVDKETGWIEEFHVESLSTDMWLTKVCSINITDVAVTHCSDPGTLVNEAYKTWTVDVTVTVHNNGFEQINCTVNAYYYNATFAQQIGTSQSITNLAPCNTITLTFSWNCLSLPVGVTYTLKANATCTCGSSDEFVNDQMTKRRWGDVNDDGKVSAADIVKVILIIGKVIPKPYYPPYMPDVNGDCKVSAADIVKIILIIQGVLTEGDC